MMIGSVTRLRGILSLILVATLGPVVYGQLDFNALDADESFRVGVVRFHQGFFQEAIIAFQRSLSFEPDRYDARLWLGRSLGRAGDVSGGLFELERLEQNNPSAQLRRFIDFQKNLYLNNPEIIEPSPMVQFATIEQQPGTIHDFARPYGTVLLDNGSILMSATGSNTIHVVDPNGRFIRSDRQGRPFFEGPSSLVTLGERIYASQLIGDFITVLDQRGMPQSNFGSSGRQLGQMLGPQHLATDGQSLYVLEVGNNRVQKFSPSGEAILFFGTPQQGFGGFEAPSSLLALGSEVWVGENENRGHLVHRFDRDGNYLGQRLISDINRVQWMEEVSGSNGTMVYLLEPDKLWMYDITRDQATLVYQQSPDELGRYTQLVQGNNSQLILSDFNRNRLDLLAPLNYVSRGYYAEIMRVDAEDFPQVTVEFRVTDPFGRGILGLDQRNFIITEERFSPESSEFIGSSYQVGEHAMAMVFSDPWQQALAADDGEAVDGVRGVLDQGQDYRFDLIGGDQGTLLNPNGQINSVTQVSAFLSESGLPPGLNTQLEYAVYQLSRRTGNRQLLLFADGDDLLDPVDQQNLAQLLRANSIELQVISRLPSSETHDFQNLAEFSGGAVHSLWHPQWQAQLGSSLVPGENGVYFMRYTSAMTSQFGERYLPLELEVRYFSFAGRDELGYFAPLVLN